MAVITGTENDDSIFNQLIGAGESDDIEGLGGNDELFGFGGDDFLNGGIGDDLMAGGVGNDTYVVDSLKDRIFEVFDSGIDTIRSSISLFMSANVEQLILTGSGGISGFGNELNNFITGNFGENLLQGGGGIDTLNGGAGADIAAEESNSDFFFNNNILSFGNSRDTLISIEALSLQGGIGNNKIDTSRFSGKVFLRGNDGNDVLLAGSDNDALEGGKGNDTLNGGVGIDEVGVSSSGTFTLTNSSLTGEGKDTLISIEKASFIFGNNDDMVNASAFSGSITVDGLGGNDKMLGAQSNDRLSGFSGNDTIVGNNGNDILAGDLGNDTLTGGSGQDSFVYNSFSSFQPSDGVDTLTDFVHGADKIALAQNTFRALHSKVGNGFSVSSEFATVNSDAVAATSSALITYNKNTGHLFYNQNGAAVGLGTGAQFATLSNHATFTASDFVIQS